MPWVLNEVSGYMRYDDIKEVHAMDAYNDGRMDRINLSHNKLEILSRMNGVSRFKLLEEAVLSDTCKGSNS